ncbi:MAG: mechanosensitive ion channel family protein [Clostridia bacterium]|nr:mechanosensitive ion channel family protein [Clostridia bacterium]
MEKRNGEKKANVGAMIVFSILAAITVAGYVLDSYVFGEQSVFNKSLGVLPVIDVAYTKIPSLIRSIQIITVAWLVVIIVRWILERLLSRSNRSRTIIKLINNFWKYFVAIIAVFLVLGAWGVDAATLLASAGIISIIIGLGAQSLISDILAGVFIVFEDEFRVGDIVIIDGWRGTVDEIGIRATRIIDWQGNIKIVNNSMISTIINQSKELSVTTCTISIGYEESIEKVELVIKNNLERIKKNIPELVDGPYYKGVNALSASSVDLLFIATVKEDDYYSAQRALNRELKIIFDENGITIPFPQVTVSYASDNLSKATASESARAAEFAAEQRNISKNLEDTNS